MGPAKVAEGSPNGPKLPREAQMAQKCLNSPMWPRILLWIYLQENSETNFFGGASCCTTVKLKKLIIEVEKSYIETPEEVDKS